MAQKGKVIEKEADKIKIQLERHSACKKCGACKMADDKSRMILEVDNYINADIGDYVEVDINSRGIVLASLIMYFIPIVSLFIGLGIGMFFGNMLKINNVELLSVIVGLLFLVVSLLFIRSYDKSFKKQTIFRPIIKKIK